MVDGSFPETAVPEAVAYMRDLLHGFGRPWFLCGGWAVDAWLGRQTRDHLDVDIALLHEDQYAVWEHFAGWALVAHDPNVADDTTEPWTGRRLDPPAHVHVPQRGETSAKHSAFEFEFILVETSGQDWVLNREPYTGQTAWGLPAEAPEVVLLNKADGVVRPHDEQDFRALLPTLTDVQRAWLWDAIRRVHPGHPWLTRLQS